MRPRSFVVLLVPAIVTAIVLAATRARAEDDERKRVRLAYDVPAACPSRTWFEGSLRFRSDRLLPLEPAALARDAYDASLKVTARADGFDGDLTIAPEGGAPTTREIRGADCQTVVDALGFAMALLLDPDGVRTGALPSDEVLTALAQRPPVDAVDETPPRAEEPVAAPPEPPPAPPIAPASAPSLRLYGEAGGGVASAVRSVRPRAHAGVELRWGRPRLSALGRLVGFVEPSGEATAPAGTVSYSPAGGRLDVGVVHDLTRSLRLGASAFVSVLVMPVDAPGADERRPSVRFVPSVGPSARLAWEPSMFGLSVEGAGGTYFTPERFRIEPGGEVFRLPALYAQATLALTIRFFDRK